MPATAVSIGNLALSHIGASSRITTLADSTAEAKQVNLWYDQCRQEALTAYNWSFARKRDALVAHSDDADEEEWFYRYTYPADCLVLRKIVNPYSKTDNAIPYTIENSDDDTERTILTNVDTATVIYTSDEDDPAKFSVAFVNALSFLIASRICYALTGKADLQDNMLKNYGAWMRMGAAYDANELVDDEPRDAEWIRER
jgi:hypothetical protein